MKALLKRALALTLTVVMLISIVCTTSVSVYSETQMIDSHLVGSGTMNGTLKWKLYYEKMSVYDYIFTVEGNGSTGNSWFDWINYGFNASGIKTVVLQGGITTICDQVFEDFTNVTDVYLPETVTTIKVNAFKDFKSLRNVYFSGSEKQWNKLAASVPGGNDYLLNANIHFEIFDSSSRLTEIPEITQIVVYENHLDSSYEKSKYKLSENAAVVTAVKTYTTNENGVVDIATVKDGTVTVKKEGFITRTFTPKQLELNNKIHLQKDSDEAPVISGVWVDDIDILNDCYTLDKASTQSLTLNVEIDWRKGSYGSIQLFQSGRSVVFNASKTSLTTVISDNFDSTEDIYIIATDSNGKSTKKLLNFVSGTLGDLTSFLDGAEFSIGDSIEVSLPKDFNPEFLAGRKIGIDIYSAIPITMSASNGRIYVAIGADLTKYSSTTEWETSATGKKNKTVERETKTFIDNIKDSFDTSDQEEIVKDLKKIKDKYKDAIKAPKGSFAVDADFTVLGYAEGVYDATGNIAWTNGSVIFNPSVEVEWSLPFTLGSVPMFFEAGFEADIKAQLNIIFHENLKKFMPEGRISGEISVFGGVGVGVNDVLGVSGGIKGKLSPDWQIRIGEEDSFKLVASLEAYAKAEIVGFEYEKEWDPILEATWVDIPKPDTSRTYLLRTAMSEGIYDTEQYTQKDLSYLGELSEFTANNGDITTVNSAVFANDIKTNTYRQSTPEYVVFDDGTALMVWLDSEKQDANSVVLYYSYFNGIQWSAPEIVYDDATLDYAHELAIINGEAYIVWQNATKAFDTTEGLEDIAAYFDISVAKFSRDSGFDVETIKYEGLDMIPTLCGGNGKVYIAWVNNSENLWFGNNDKNEIVYCEYNGEELSEVIVAYNGLYSVNSLSVDYSKKLNIAYAADTDSNVATVDDIRVFENGVRVSDATVYEGSPKYYNGQLYWISDVNLTTRNGNGNVVSDITSNYQFVEINGCLAAVYTKSEGYGSSVNISLYNEETQSWSEGYAVTDNEKYITSFSCAVEDDELKILANFAELVYEDETNEKFDSYGTATLSLVTMSPETDLTVGSIIYNSSDYVEWLDMKVSFDLTNNGTSVINQTKVDVIDEKGKVLNSEIINSKIAPGETLYASTSFLVTDAAKGSNITVKAEPVGLNDVNIADNSGSVNIQFEDLGIEDMYWGINSNDCDVIYASVVNRGYNKRNNISVSLRANAKDGEILETVVIDSVDAMSLESVVYDISAYNAETYYITIDESGDSLKANDYSFLGSGLFKTEMIIDVENYTVRIPDASEINHIRFAKGEYTNSMEIKNAPDRVDLSSKVINNCITNDVFSYEMKDGGIYTFWIRLNDGTTCIKTVDLTVMNQEIVTNGVQITVKNLYGVKDFFIAEGNYDSYAEMKQEGYIFSATSNKIGENHDYTYTVSNSGVHTVIVRYMDETRADSVYKVDLTVDEPVFTPNGLQITISNIPGVRVIRTAYGEYNTPGEVKRAEGSRSFSNKAVIKNRDPYTIQYREEGMVTITVEYNNGYVSVFHHEIKQKTSQVSVNGDTVTLSDLDDFVLIRYAEGEYSTVNQIKSAKGNKVIKPKDLMGENAVISELKQGVYTFYVQFDDESYNYFTVTVK